MSFQITRKNRHFIGLVCLIIFCAAQSDALRLQLDGFPSLDITGSDSLSWRTHSVDGAGDVYRYSTPGGPNSINHTAALSLRSLLAPNLTLDAAYSVSPYMKRPPRWTLKYDGQGGGFSMGTITPYMGSNEFVRLNRSLVGMQTSATIGKASVYTLSSMMTAPVQTDILTGNNTSGPYYLSRSPVVSGSEVVMLRDKRLERNKDYTINYSTGQMHFLASSHVTPADSVTINYEVAVSGIEGGKLTSFRAEYAQSSNFLIGLSHLQLSAGHETAMVRTQRDQFNGTNLPGPFQLSSRPIIPQSDVVRINGIIQQRNIAYTLDYDNGRLLFNLGYAPPFNAIVIVEYRVGTAETTAAERTITGADIVWQARPGLKITAQAAKSTRPSNEMNEQGVTEEFIITPDSPPSRQRFTVRQRGILPRSDKVSAMGKPLARGRDYEFDESTGEIRLLTDSFPSNSTGIPLTVSYLVKANNEEDNSAVKVRADLNQGKINAYAQWRRVGEGFSPLETASYNSAREGLEWYAGYAPLDILSFTTTGSNTRQPANPYAINGSSTQMTDMQSRTYSVDLHHPALPQITLQRSTNDTNATTGGTASSNITDSIYTSWSRGGFSTNLAFYRMNSSSTQPAYFGSSGETYRYDALSNNLSLTANYQPISGVDFSVNATGYDATTTQSGMRSATKGDSISGNLSYRPSSKLSLNASLQQAHAGAGKDYTGATLPPTTTNTASLGANWQASKTVTVDVNHLVNNAEGSSTPNIGDHTTTAAVNWTPGERTRLNGYITRQGANYNPDEGTTSTTMIGTSATIGNIGKGTLDIDAQHIWGNTSDGVTRLWQSEGQSRRAVNIAAGDPMGGYSSPGTRITTLAGKFRYPIANKQELFLAGQSEKSSGLPATYRKDALQLGWNYLLTDRWTFTVGAGLVQFVDESDPTQNYRARQFNAGMVWKF